MITLLKRMALLSMIVRSSAAMAQPPLSSPSHPIPSGRQLAWHNLEYYAFVHFGINTFTDREWGYGDESPSLFNPTEFNGEETVRQFREAGMKAVILTAKHHDGFCLWPSNLTKHSINNSPWKQGRGDIVREFSEACRRQRMKFGIYLSPWDRNHPDYGKPEYITYYRAQLTELLTQYGEISEVWFDGANGGDGYYGGAREVRTIDRTTYYGWEETWALVRQLQPNAVIFSDVGPDIRWVGNEQGFAGETCWATYSPVGEKGGPAAPGDTRYREGIEGHRNGKYWIPPECDVSIRPGWFYHEKEDSLVKSSRQLLDLYFQSVGRNGSLLLNVPLDRRGRIAMPDSASLMGFKRLRDQLFERDYAIGAMAEGSKGAANLIDRNDTTYWMADDTAASITLTLSETAVFDCLVLQEYIALGQRVEEFSVERREGSEWKEITSGTTIGRKRLLRFSAVKSDAIRIIIHRSKAVPVISTISIYDMPE